MIASAALSAEWFEKQNRQRVAVVTGLAIGGAIPLGAIAGAFAAGGHFVGVIAMIGLFVPVLIWRQPAAIVYLGVGLAATIEQFGPALPVPIWTDQIPLFKSLSDGLGLSGIYFNPEEMLLALFLLFWFASAVADRTLDLPRTQLGLAMLIFAALIVFGLGRGLAGKGQLKDMLWEIRPWFYLAATYILASQLVRSRRHLDLLLWIFVLGVGLKGLQGSYRGLLLLNVQPRPQEIMSHEESLFYGLFIILTAGLWLWGMRGKLRTVATLLLPAVMFANLANQRRVAWFIVAGGMAALLIASWLALPERRPLMKRVLIATLVFGCMYVPAFWNSSSALGQPVRSLQSIVAPDNRDLQSNQYRQQEDANLELNIQHSMPFGEGFGVPIVYSLPIVDISNVDAFIAFVPHDGVLYVWMRLGVPGIMAFWFLIGSAIVSVIALIRVKDRKLALFGTVVLCALVGYVILGAFDMGFFWFRVALLMGTLLGALEAARRLSPAPGPAKRSTPGPTPIRVRDSRTPASSAADTGEHQHWTKL
jgi:hypothetical protein